MPEVLTYGFMVRALVAALLVGLAAPSVGVFLVQRRLSLIGDGMGHVALTGVALGLLTGTAPVPVALVVTVAAATVVELLRRYGRAGGDVVLAVLFYGGIAGGVVLVARAGGSAATLNTYLFGAITTTTAEDLRVFAVLAAVVMTATLGLGRRLAAVSSDEEHARASGLPVTGLNLLLAVLTAVTVVLSMRVVGLLLISALMIVPVAVAQQVCRSFRGTTATAMVVGVLSAVVGVVTSYYVDTPSGGTIVLYLIALFVVAATGSALLRAARHRGHRRSARSSPAAGTGPAAGTHPPAPLPAGRASSDPEGAAVPSATSSTTREGA